MGRYLGIDIGGTKCAVVLAEAGCGIRLLEKERFDTLAERGKEQTLRRLYEAIDALLSRCRMAREQIAAVGISCGGPLDSRRGRILSPPNLPGWDDVPIVELVSAHTGAPAYLQNDANACALVEWKLGAGRGTENMVFLTMGTGMGAGIIAEGRLLRGADDLAGEVGHLRLADDGPVGHGKAGSFEGFASGGGIARWAQAWAAEGRLPAWNEAAEDHRTVQMLAEAARQGDGAAVSFWEAVGEKLGAGIAVLADVLNPACVVIGSVFVRCEGLLRPAMERALRQEALPGVVRNLRVLPAETGEALGDLASIMVALYATGVDPMA